MSDKVDFTEVLRDLRYRRDCINTAIRNLEELRDLYSGTVYFSLTAQEEMELEVANAAVPR